jgi:hypothetical protein
MLTIINLKKAIININEGLERNEWCLTIGINGDSSLIMVRLGLRIALIEK